MRLALPPLLLSTILFPVTPAFSALSCHDLDNGVFDKFGSTCAAYTTFPQGCAQFNSGQQNDADFNSSELCCACGGGRTDFLQNCTVGEQPISDSACEPCPLGQYTNATDNSFCTACSSGATTLNTGSLSIEDCIACGAGSQSITGTCEPCDVGKFSAEAANSECTPCPGGTFNAVIGADSQDKCLQCADETDSFPGSSVCCPLHLEYAHPGALDASECFTLETKLFVCTHSNGEIPFCPPPLHPQ
jgi:hypothetical protein